MTALQQADPLPQIPPTLHERLHALPPLDSIYQLHQPRILLQPLAPIPRQLLIMHNLIQHDICIREPLPNHKRPALGKITRPQVLLHSREELGALIFAVRGVLGVFVGGEEGVDEQGAPCGVSALGTCLAMGIG